MKDDMPKPFEHYQTELFSKVEQGIARLKSENLPVTLTSVAREVRVTPVMLSIYYPETAQLIQQTEKANKAERLKHRLTLLTLELEQAIANLESKSTTLK